MSLTPGTRIGPYEITAALGAGGMGEVYRATDTNLKRAVAIKVLPASVSSDPDRLARFQREAEVLAALNHPNIAQVHGLEKANGITALVMELVEGATLADRIALGAIPLDEALPIAKQIAEALEAAHEQGIVHRDLKPMPAVPVTKLALSLPRGQAFTGTLGQMLSVSPDGRRIAYVANNEIYVRAMDDLAARRVPGTRGERTRSVVSFVFSPDGESLAYLADGTLRSIPIAGGAAQAVVASGMTDATLASWGPTGILLVTDRGVMKVAPGSGPPALVAGIDPKREIVRGAQMLPDGQTVLFTVASTSDDLVDRWDKGTIVAQTGLSGARRILIKNGRNVRYAPTGHLVYMSGGVLQAVAFDASRLEVSGAPVTVVEGVRTQPSSGASQFAIADNGTLVYIPGSPAAASLRQHQIALMDRAGTLTVLDARPAPYYFPRFSPDGRQLAFASDDGREAIVWIYNLGERTAMRRLTFGGRNTHPIWSRDGVWITYQSNREGAAALFRQRADGSGAPERLTHADPEMAHVPQSWSPGDERLLFTVNRGGVVGLAEGATNRGMTSVLQILDARTRAVAPFGGIEAADRAVNAEFSPDGRWVAYSTGIRPSVVYVQPYPGNGAVYQLSASDDGHHPMWSRDGREIVYVPGPDDLARVRVTPGPTLAFSTAELLPRARMLESPVSSRNIDMSPDGTQFAGVVDAGTSELDSLSEVHVVLNWFGELKRLVPTK